MLASVWLGDKELVEVHAHCTGTSGVESMLGVDEGGSATSFLGFGDDMETDGCFTTGFWSIDFGDATTGEAADSEG